MSFYYADLLLLGNWQGQGEGGQIELFSLLEDCCLDVFYLGTFKYAYFVKGQMGLIQGF